MMDSNLVHNTARSKLRQRAFSLKSDVWIAICYVVSWLILDWLGDFAYWHNPAATSFVLLFSTFLTTMGTRSLAPLRSLRVLPRRTDLIHFMIVGLVATSCSELLLRLFGEASLAPLSVIAWFSVPQGLLTFCLYTCLMQQAVWLGVRRHIYLDVSPSELKRLLKALGRQGLTQQLKLGNLDDLSSRQYSHIRPQIDALITSRNATHSFAEDGLLLKVFVEGVPIFEISDLLILLEGRVRLNELNPANYLCNGIEQTILLRSFHYLKRILEPLVALVLLLLTTPLLLAIALAIKLDSKGPVLYIQTRLGHHGRPFRLLKFRSMRTDAESNGPQWAGINDSRITRAGVILRKTRLDELPQLLNVIRGEMGFVGPRPERPEFYDKVRAQIPLFSLRLLVKPGITGWAQVNAGYAASVEESKTKLEYDLFYIQNMSPRLDLLILVRTLLVAITGAERLQDKVLSSDFEAEQPAVATLPLLKAS